MNTSGSIEVLGERKGLDLFIMFPVVSTDALMRDTAWTFHRCFERKKYRAFPLFSRTVRSEHRV